MKKLAGIYDLPAGRRARLFDLAGTLRFTAVDLDDVDGRYEGQLEDGSWCVWTIDGRRIEYGSGTNGWVATSYPEPDPAYPGRKP